MPLNIGSRLGHYDVTALALDVAQRERAGGRRAR